MSYTWLQFKAAVDSLLGVDANRRGLIAAKELKVRMAVQKLQTTIDKYRVGHQDIFTPSDFVPSGFSSQGVMPDSSEGHACEPRDCFIVKKKTKTVTNSVDAADDEITVTDHGITAVTESDSLSQVQIGRLRNTGGALPAGLVAGQSYFIRVVDENTLTLHTTAGGTIDNTQRVDITGDGTGTTELDFAMHRYPVKEIAWKERYSLIHQSACISDSGLVSFDPNGLSFLVFPQIPSGEDTSGYNWSFEFNWDGCKIEWEDSNATPLDDPAVEYVAESVTAWFRAKVDQDHVLAEVSKRESKSLLAGAYLKSRRQKQQRP